MGTQVPLPQRGTASQFSAHICCGQMARWIKAPLGRKVGLDRSDIALDGDPALPPPKGAEPSQFSARVYCAQMPEWIKMPLCMEAGLGPGHIVLDGDPAFLPQKEGTARPPIFGPCLLWSNGWMDQDATWYGGRPRPKRHCVRWGPISSPPKWGRAPQFSAHVYCGQTAA